MDYLVFARRWRPQKFEEVIGQDQAVTTLKNAISIIALLTLSFSVGREG